MLYTASEHHLATLQRFSDFGAVVQVLRLTCFLIYLLSYLYK